MKLKPQPLAKTVQVTILLADCADLLDEYESTKKQIDGTKFRQLMDLVDNDQKSQHWITFDSLCHGCITTRQQRTSLASYLRSNGPMKKDAHA